MGRWRAYPRRVVSDRHLLHITCPACAGAWAGSERAHCSACHRTFDDVELFDAHRADGRCRCPEELGLISTRNGIWLGPLGTPAEGSSSGSLAAAG
jgi:hypothetical protein